MKLSFEYETKDYVFIVLNIFVEAWNRLSEIEKMNHINYNSVICRKGNKGKWVSSKKDKSQPPFYW